MSETMSTWVSFVASREPIDVQALGENLRLNHYCIDEVVPVVGESPAELAQGWHVVRVESSAPVQLPENVIGESILFPGMTQHLHYTSASQNQALAQRSRAELAPSGETTAVLIPIRKSAAWWQLAQDERYAHFQTNGQTPGHTAIGIEYVDRVFRRLYHSRYGSPPVPYDFLTYFEFERAYKEDFRHLLTELREVERNPEWQYVEREFEVWMTKMG
jgi:hypothetical protein